MIRPSHAPTCSLCLVLAASALTLAAQSQDAKSRPQRGDATLWRRGAQLKVIQLPRPRLSGSMTVEQALTHQLDTGPMSAQTLDPEVVGQLAWSAVVGRPRPTQTLDPRAATQEPMQIWFVVPGGLYRYNANEHSVEQESNQDLRQPLAVALGNPAAVFGAGMIFTSSLRGASTRMASRAQKAMYLEAGRMTQDLRLQAISLGLSVAEFEDFDALSVGGACGLTRNIVAQHVLLIGYRSDQSTPTPGTTRTGQATKRAALIIPPQGFTEDELSWTVQVLMASAIQPVLVSMRAGVPITGQRGGSVVAELALNQLRLNDYDAIVFLGGTGAVEDYNNPDALGLARNAANQGKVLAAISISPGILANAGVLKGVRVTGLAGEQEHLIQAGAQFTGNPVQRDGKIITAMGPEASKDFASTIAQAVLGQ